MMPEQLLAAGLAALGLELDTGAQTKLQVYLVLLDKWNRTHNLTAIREPERMVTHHVLDSLAVLPHLPAQARLNVIDIGSGGGLPGVPLAIARPNWHIVLLDSNHKKAAFLRQVSIELPLPNVEVVASRVEDYAPPALFDVAISRAFAELAMFGAVARRLLVPGGRVVAMKGVYPHEELAHLPPGLRVTATPALQIPGLEAERHLIVLEAVEA